MKTEATEPVTSTKLTLQIIFQRALAKNVGMFLNVSPKFTARSRTFMVSIKEKQIMGHFTLFRSSKNDEYYFNLKAGNHEIILQSEGYKAKSGAENGIESVRLNAEEDAKFERLVATNGQHYFNLKSGNGQVIGTSEMYTTKASAEVGIASVKSNAPDAEVVEA